MITRFAPGEGQSPDIRRRAFLARQQDRTEIITKPLLWANGVPSIWTKWSIGRVSQPRFGIRSNRAVLDHQGQPEKSLSWPSQLPYIQQDELRAR